MIEQTPSQIQYDVYCRIIEEREYWKTRCELAEAIDFGKAIDPFDLMLSKEELSARIAYNDFLSNNKEPK